MKSKSWRQSAVDFYNLCRSWSCIAGNVSRLLTVREYVIRPCLLALPMHTCYCACKPSETRIVCEPMLYVVRPLYIEFQYFCSSVFMFFYPKCIFFHLVFPKHFIFFVLYFYFFLNFLSIFHNRT